MNNLLTNDELVELTGYRYPSKQCEVLRRSGVSFVIRRDGHPRVTWMHVNAVLNGAPTDPPIEDEDQPNFEGI
ncbi:hypothetical protein B4923_20615 [Brenneria roseae subsp. americana]|uniref:DUF4224 domain-containing protein n=1 Tax=Brenneria roseae subsp. americana TaxID=1508507 RepID=A0A2U1TIP1_9GAMM|nr:DUF4224 domain-containing protein [Brenneria roseae]PWC09229.1 hypothetical protein B4923_20615 [Brenneria roseae subsp. americana]